MDSGILSLLCNVRLRRGAAESIAQLTIDSRFSRRFALPCWYWGVGRMESNQRFYMRRAAEERTAAQRAMTEQARSWHAKLAHDFAERAAASSMPLAATA
jgi:hypothetical protein